MRPWTVTPAKGSPVSLSRTVPKIGLVGAAATAQDGPRRPRHPRAFQIQHATVDWDIVLDQLECNILERLRLVHEDPDGAKVLGRCREDRGRPRPVAFLALGVDLRDPEA